MAYWMVMVRMVGWNVNYGDSGVEGASREAGARARDGEEEKGRKGKKTSVFLPDQVALPYEHLFRQFRLCLYFFARLGKGRGHNSTVAWPRVSRSGQRWRRVWESIGATAAPSRADGRSRDRRLVCWLFREKGRRKKKRQDVVGYCDRATGESSGAT